MGQNTEPLIWVLLNNLMITKAHIHSSVTRIRKYCSKHLQIYIQHKQSFLESTNIFNNKAIQKHKLLKYTCTTNLISTYIAITQQKKSIIYLFWFYTYTLSHRKLFWIYIGTTSIHYTHWILNVNLRWLIRQPYPG